LGNWLLTNLLKFKTVLLLPLDVQLTGYGAAARELFLSVGPLLISACQLTGRASVHWHSSPPK
jgi:hypothetical protein